MVEKDYIKLGIFTFNTQAIPYTNKINHKYNIDFLDDIIYKMRYCDIYIIGCQESNI